MANNLKDYVIAAMQEAGMSDDSVVAALDKIAANEKLGPKLNGIVKTATEDYNAQVGRVNTLTQRNEYLEKTWYPQADAAYKNIQTEYQKALGEIERLNAGGAPPAFDPSKYMTKEDMQAQERSMATRLSGVVKDIGRLASRHVINFKEELDTNALDEMAMRMAQERGVPAGTIPITDVYEKFIEPRKKAQEEEGRKNWEKETRAQIEKDLRSANNLPAAAAPVEQSQMFRPTPQDQIPKDMDMELLSTWNNAANGSGH